MDKRVEQFINLAQKRWEYLEMGDSRNGNKCFDELQKLVEEFRAENCMELLLVLLEYPNYAVQFEAASKLLPFYTKKSLNTLKGVAENRGILPFAAKQTIRQWENGNMKR